MHDVPNHEGLYRLAEEQGGYFSAEQAKAHGFSRSLLAHHARRGSRFERVGHGLYRIRLFPSSPHEHIVAAWMAVGPEVAVVSHESALELYGLSDVLPALVHLTVPRNHRWQKAPRGVKLHTTSRALEGRDVRRWEGVRTTAPERTLLDVAEAGIDPDQLRLAIAQALERGLISRASLEAAAKERSRSVREAVARAAAVAA